MVDGITFDVGSVSSPIFAMPDASGLVPLSLPEVFLEKQRTIVPQPYSDIQLVKPSAEAVSRFEAAMCENLLPVNLARINNLIERGMSPAIAKTVVAANEGTGPFQSRC